MPEPRTTIWTTGGHAHVVSVSPQVIGSMILKAKGDPTDIIIFEPEQLHVVTATITAFAPF